MSQPNQQPNQSYKEQREGSRWNIPNALCVTRLILSVAMVLGALMGQPILLLTLYLLAAATDWIDGKLAIWLNQRTVFGARLDSVADAATYAALLFGSVWLKGDAIAAEAAWIAMALACWLTSYAAGLIKLGCLPSYHTYTAKASWGLMILAAVGLLTGWSLWPLRLAMLAVALANLEAVAITFILQKTEVDVRSFWHALQMARHDKGS